MASHKTNLVDVETFLVVSRELSISGAARVLDVSKSVVSRRLTRLERTLGVQLLQRTTRKTELTEEGQLYSDDLGTLGDTIRRANERLQERRHKPSGHLRIVLPSYLGSSVITNRVIPQFLNTHRDVSIEARLTDAGPFAIPRDFDLFVMTRLPDRPLPDSTLRQRKLGRLKSSLFVSKAYLDREGSPKEPKDLQNHACVSYRGRHWRFKKKGERSEVVQVSGPLTTGSNEILKAAVLSGLGIAYSFDAVFEKELEAGLVQPLLEDWTEDAGLDLRILTPGQAYPPLRVRYFSDALKAHLSLTQS